MHPLEKETLKILRQEQLVQAGERVLIGTSGGPDSQALLHVLARLAPDLNITLAAVYVNHGLRPAEAGEENSLVRAEADRLGVLFFSGAVDVIGLAARQKLSPEHAARLLRYDFFNNTAREWGAKKIAVAHTADDQAEEILLRLLRGTARKGLSGMKTFRDHRIIRPFLRFPKELLLEYLAKNGIPFLLDSSNTQELYLRNRIRNDLLPYLADRYNPDIRQTLLRTANILQDEEELLEKMTEAAFAETFTAIQKSPARKKGDSTHSAGPGSRELLLNLDRFSLQPRPIQRRLLEKGCWHMACEPRSRQIEQLLHLATQKSSNGILHLADGLRVARNRNELCFAYPNGRSPLRGNLADGTRTEVPETSIPAPGTYAFPGLQKELRIESIDMVSPVPGDIFPTGEYLDAALFSFPLTLRGPRPGDRFHPLGAPGSKKVHDFLSAQKIETRERGLVPILCADESILALPGLRIDHHFRITEKTAHAVRVFWEDMGKARRKV